MNRKGRGSGYRFLPVNGEDLREEFLFLRSKHQFDVLIFCLLHEPRSQEDALKA